MRSHVFWPFLTYLPTLSYVPFWGLSLTPLPTLILNVINGPSLRYTENVYKQTADELLFSDVVITHEDV